MYCLCVTKVTSNIKLTLLYSNYFAIGTMKYWRMVYQTGGSQSITTGESGK